MKRNETKVEKEAKTENKFDLKEAFALWKQTSKNGLDYLTGKTSGKEEFRLVAYFNTNKKNPKEPDIRIYEVDSEGKQGNEVCDLWESVSRKENRYLTGTTNDKENIIAFYEKEEAEKRPYIRAYYRKD